MVSVKRFVIRHLLIAATAAALLAGTAATAAAVPRSFYGVVNQGTLSASDYEAMGEAGVGTLRILISWDDRLQPARGDCCAWAASGYDALIGHAAAQNVEVLPFIVGSPSWAVRKGGPRPPRSRAAMRAWKAFLRAFVERYGRHGDFWDTHRLGGQKPIKTIQIWNEPSSPAYWTNRRPSGRQYARLVIRSHRAIRRVDPRVKVMLAGLFAAPSQKRARRSIEDFLADFYEVRGVKRAFDVAAIHPYAAEVRALRRRMSTMRRAMDEAGDKRTPIQVSELGWSSGGSPNRFRRSPRGQANSLRKSFALLTRGRHRWRVSGINWFSWQDIPAESKGVCGFCPDSGLFEQDGSPKPAWEAFQKFTR